MRNIMATTMILIKDADKRHTLHQDLSVFCSFQAHIKEGCCIVTKHEEVRFIVSVEQLKGAAWQCGEVLLPRFLN